MEIEVYGWGGAYLGLAKSFGEAKRMQLSSLPDDLKEAYGGINIYGYPLFSREDLTPELLDKYPQLRPTAED